MNKYFDEDIDYIPSEYESSNIELKSNISQYNIELKKSIYPPGKFLKVDKKVKEETDYFYNKAKKLKPFSYFTIPYWNFQSFINPYFFVNYTKEVYTFYQKDNVFFKEFQSMYDTLQKKYERIELYDNISTITYFNSWEVYKNYPFIKNNKKIKSLFVFNQLVISSLEEYSLYREKYSKYSYSDVIDALELPNFLIGSQLETPKNIRTNFKKKYNHINYMISNANICEKNGIETIKNLLGYDSIYDIIEISCILFDWFEKNIAEYKNSQLFFNSVLLVFCLLKKNGNFKINIRDSSSKLTSDILFLLLDCFDKVYISKSSSTPVTRPYKNIVCIGFKGIENKKLEKLMEIKYKWYEIENSCGKDIKEKKNSNYVTSILSFEKKPILFYDLLNYYNKIFELRNQIIYIKITELYTRFYNLKNNDSEIKKLDNTIRNNQLKDSIEWLTKNDLKVKHKYNLKEIGRTQISNIIENNKKSLNFTFKHHKEKLPINLDANKKYEFEISQKLLDCEKELIFYKRVIDTRNLKKWEQLSKKINVFSELKQYISSKYAYHNVTRAFIKLYEILYVFDLLDKKKKTHSTFHICEFPGQFIIATNYYLKTNTDNQKFDWKAQSLNPRNHLNIKKYGKNIFDDVYHLMKNYPDNWLYGVDGTGDITKTSNVKFYKSFTKNKDLFTFDCGLSSDSPYEMLYQQNKISKIQYSAFLFILNNLSKGKNFVYKIFLPGTIPYIISMIYVLYCSFEQLSFYKPTVHQGSSEFYIIGKKYKGITDELMTYLFKKKNSLSLNYGLFPSRLISYEFKEQYEKFIEDLTNDNVSQIMRTLYCYDNPDEIKKYEKYLEKIKKNKTKEWIENFKFKNISFFDHLDKN